MVNRPTIPASLFPPPRVAKGRALGSCGIEAHRIVRGLRGAPTPASSLLKGRRATLSFVALALGVAASVRAHADEPPPPAPSEGIRRRSRRLRPPRRRAP